MRGQKRGTCSRQGSQCVSPAGSNTPSPACASPPVPPPHAHGLLTQLILTLFPPRALLGSVVPPVVCKGSKHRGACEGEGGKRVDKRAETCRPSLERTAGSPCSITGRNFSNEPSKRNSRTQSTTKGRRRSSRRVSKWRASRCSRREGAAARQGCGSLGKALL